MKKYLQGSTTRSGVSPGPLRVDLDGEKGDAADATDKMTMR